MSDHPELRPSAETIDEWQGERRRRLRILAGFGVVGLAVWTMLALGRGRALFILAAVGGLGTAVVHRLATKRQDRAREHTSGAAFAGKATLHAVSQLGHMPLTAQAVGSARFPWWQALGRPLDMLTGRLYVTADTADGHSRGTSPARPAAAQTFAWRWEPGGHARSVGAKDFSVGRENTSRIEVEIGRKHWRKVRLNILPTGHIDFSVQDSQRLARLLGDAAVASPAGNADDSPPST